MREMSALDSYISQGSAVESFGVRGRVDSVRGLTVRVSDFSGAVDSAVEIITGNEGRIAGQVVGFENQYGMVMALGTVAWDCAGGTWWWPRSAGQRIVCSCRD